MGIEWICSFTDPPKLIPRANKLQAKTLWKQAYQQLANAVVTFESVKDKINVALVKCNLGKLMRVGYCAELMQGRIGNMPSRHEHELHEKVQNTHCSQLRLTFRLAAALQKTA